MNRRQNSRAKRHYDVGYCKPPKHAQFKKGNSGNPKGRPRRSRSSKNLLGEALNARVLVNERGIPKKMSQREAIFKTLVTRALKGEPRSVALLLSLMDKYDLIKTEDMPERIEIILVEPKHGTDHDTQASAPGGKSSPDHSR